MKIYDIHKTLALSLLASDFGRFNTNIYQT